MVIPKDRAGGPSFMFAPRCISWFRLSSAIECYVVQSTPMPTGNQYILVHEQFSRSQSEVSITVD